MKLAMTRSTKLANLVFGTAFAVVLLLSGRAQAADECQNDDDCAGAECGGQVCDWNAVGGHKCRAADATKKGLDGWCTETADCKCKGLGATCVTAYCTFTLPSQAPGAGATGGSSGSGSGGTSAGSGGTSGGSGGSSGGTPPPSDGGGCAVAGIAGSAAPLSLSALVALAALAGVRRRRK